MQTLHLVLWLECQTPNQVYPGTNLVLLFQTFTKFVRRIYRSSSLSCMDEYQTVDTGGHLCRNSLIH